MKACMPFHNAETALLYQLPVYQAVRRCILEHRCNSVLDIGCGNPQKLRAYVYPFVDRIVGVDLFEIINKISVEFGTWISCDLEKDKLELEEKFDIIVVADVIEHIKNVKNLFDIIKRHAHKGTFILISTPNRVGDGSDNLYHVKEYIKDEFIFILEDNKLNVKLTTSYTERNGKQDYINNFSVCLMEN